MNEELVIKQVKEGEKDAFEYLYEKYKTKIYRYIFSKIKNETEAEDLLQETFTKVYNNINYYRKEDGSFYSFLLINAKHLIIEYVRKCNRRKEKFENNSMKFVNLEESRKLEEIVEESEERYFLKKFIDELCETQRMAIYLIYMKNMSYKDAARVMNKTELSFKSILHRAKKTLYARIMEEYPEMKDKSSTKDIAKMVIISFVCMSMLTGLGYAAFKVYKHIFVKEKYTISDLREEVSENESIISKEDAVTKINEYLTILGEDANVISDDVHLIRNLKVNEICWLFKSDNFTIEISAYDGILIDYSYLDSKVAGKKNDIEEIYRKLNLPNDYKLCRKENVNELVTMEFAKKYGDIYNKYECVKFIIEDDVIKSISLIRYPYKDSEVLVSKERAKEILRENNIDVKEIELGIEVVNEVEFENLNKKYEEINFDNAQVQELNKIDIDVRKVWRVTSNANDRYLVDTKTGEVFIKDSISVEVKNKYGE